MSIGIAALIASVRGEGDRDAEAGDAVGAVSPALTLSGIPASKAGDLLGPAIAARRLFARDETKAPKDNTAEAFARWLKDIGETIEDLDEIADCYVTMCELQGVPISQEFLSSLDALIAEPGAVEPAQAASVSAPASPDPVVVLAPAPKPAEKARRPPTGPATKLTPVDAAERFAEWLRLSGHCGQHNTLELSALYDTHCKAERLAPIGEQYLRSALEDVEGIKKSYARGKRRNGKRYQPTIWTIKPLAFSSAIPWEDLPQAPKKRKAA